MILILEVPYGSSLSFPSEKMNRLLTDKAIFMEDAPEDWSQGGGPMGVATTVVRYPLTPDTTGESLRRV
jgi:hypothetical protein